jgi:DNA-binding MarR family transcriptional regulator
MRMNELSSALGVVPRTVTTIIDSLETEGLLVRLPDSADRRATLLEITQAGLRQLGQLHATHEVTAAEVFDVLTTVEKRQLVKLLRRLQAAAKADSEVSPSDGIELANPRPKKKSSR